jgi:hypothetical protein
VIKVVRKKKSKKKNNKKFVTPKTTIQELEGSRDGGQIALRGFTYQFLYSCYLILSEIDADTVFHLEGIEDIDQIKYKDATQNITHIQLKYSTAKQDASFLKDILKNFLEAYLLDSTRNFRLVYDFSVAKGNLSKLFTDDLDDKATLYWTGVIEQIKSENSCWNWNNFVFQDFCSKLSFEKREKNNLANEIEVELIKAYDITTDNITIFANSIKIRCLEKMEQRTGIDKHELDRLIQSVKDDISKGPQNPAHSWIKRLDFHTAQVDSDLSYFEGKKATPQDIALQLPVKRLQLEREIKDAIQDNRVTIIKAPSGQGKTTLALQVSLDLQNEYTVYQLLWCNDSKELSNIVQFFKSRVRLGEKPLIFIDNLDSQVSEWNRLAQLLQEEVSYHYKLLLTTREDDWYSYGGDLSNVRAVQTIKLALKEIEAQEIFDVLKKANKLHPSISDWRKAWAKVADKKLLIEYIYLLTHGEMLSERIAHQISQINKSDTGRIKCEILRKVCFADICGIKLSVKKLIASLSEPSASDYGEILKSIENEFLIRVNIAEKFIEGLHPVRSQHIVDKLHEFFEINDTAIQVAQISDLLYLSKLFSNLPNIISRKESFYFDITNALWNSNDLSYYVLALQGLFSGSVMQYFHQNREAFDDANAHGGLFLVATELNPFTRFKEFDLSLDTLDMMKKTLPDNSNIEYLCNLRDTTPKLTLTETDIFYFCKALYNKLDCKNLFEVTSDVDSYSAIAYWLYNIDSDFNLSKNISLQKIWAENEKYSTNVISSIMYTCFCGNKDVYLHFVEENLSGILTYLKSATRSLKLYVSEDKKAIHVEYLLLLSDIKKGNEESVLRLKTVCKTLPIFEQYCSDAIKPTLERLSGYNIPDDAHKTMPIRNIVIMFHQEFASLWNKTIMSNYECDTIAEWLEHWFSVRRNIVTLFEKSSSCICKMLEGRPLGNLATDVDNLRMKIVKSLIGEIKYPNEDRPFEERAKLPEGFSKVRSGYFQSIQNFFNQFVGFLRKDADDTRLAIVNLQTARSTLGKMQVFFADVSDEQRLFQRQHAELCGLEEQRLEYLLMACMYYQEHQPSKYFDKYQIKAWYNANYTETIKETQSALSTLSEEYFVDFPEKYYREGVLIYYPIIVHNLDIEASDVIMRFFYDCIPFAETIFDYLVVICKNTQGDILPTGLKVPKTFFTDLRKAIDTDDEDLAGKLTPPFPIDITPQMLECFQAEYEALTPIATGYEGIDKVGELLWAYSKTLELLTDECDSEYRDCSRDNLKSEILSVLASYKQKISPKDYEELYSICKEVFNGQIFDDTSFNEFCEKIIPENKYSL